MEEALISELIPSTNPLNPVNGTGVRGLKGVRVNGSGSMVWRRMLMIMIRTRPLIPGRTFTAKPANLQLRLKQELVSILGLITFLNQSPKAGQGCLY